ncbi:MAG: hypothetical protein Q4E74_08265 [Ruminococcus sp.]|nr:hypothetical protein [Ruminococcus sp.]
MTDKELKRLSRSELLELMLYLKKELDSEKSENEELRKKLEEKNTAVTALKDELKALTQGVRLLCEAQGIEFELRNKDNEENSPADAASDENGGGAGCEQ